MTKTLDEAVEFVDRLAAVSIPVGVQPFVLPAHTALATARARLPAASRVLLGAQNAHWAPDGAWTGEISMRMAADAGAVLVEMGHSERREHFGETDQSVAAKAAAALDHELIPLICVGEPAAVRDAGDADTFVSAQVTSALSRLSPSAIGRCLMAYEPIWAIGESGRPATRAEVGPIMRRIVDTVAATSGGGALRGLLYGGSVGLDNAAELLADPCADGLFVGRAAWPVDGFLELIDIAAARLSS